MLNAKLKSGWFTELMSGNFVRISTLSSSFVSMVVVGCGWKYDTGGRGWGWVFLRDGRKLGEVFSWRDITMRRSLRREAAQALVFGFRTTSRRSRFWLFLRPFAPQQGRSSASPKVF